MSTAAAAPAKPTPFLLTLAAIVAGFAIFALILFIAYLPSKPPAIQADNGTLTPAERLARLNEMRAKEHAAATSYAWIDQEKRIVRIPIDEAVRLTVRDLSAAQTKEASQ
ncbi:hypothetical protein [Geminisphaera colitermitum]|uniref:hypothetical protein n=1 Tax=Geminisphaera colitermitum TaxID=1148786 RepID=UPI000158C7E0|nr:hypothetical protein [Geminisphaera colitermitum]